MTAAEQIVSAAITTALLCALAAACLALTLRRGQRRVPQPPAEPIVPPADDNTPGTDEEALATCMAIYRAGTANRRNTRGGTR